MEDIFKSRSKKDVKSKKHVKNKEETNFIVRLSDLSMAYEPYANRYGRRINSELFDYLENEKCSSGNVHINVYSNDLVNDEIRQHIFAKTVSEAFATKRKELKKEIKSCFAYGFFFLLISLSVIIASVFIPKDHKALEVFALFMDVVAWVFGWAAVERLLQVWIRLRTRRKHLLKLEKAEYTFYEEPKPRHGEPILDGTDK